jgi:hypothetical protein
MEKDFAGIEEKLWENVMKQRSIWNQISMCRKNYCTNSDIYQLAAKYYSNPTASTITEKGRTHLKYNNPTKWHRIIVI